MHVTLRLERDLPSLRDRFLAPHIAGQLVRKHAGFRIIHYSIQGNHIHLLVEALGRATFLSGMRSLTVRLAMSINRMLGHQGRVFADRYHARAVATPRAAHHALVYVLNNHLKHIDSAAGFDPFSSSAWFRGWSCPPPRPQGPSPAAPLTWLARSGWRRHGLISPDARPGPASWRQPHAQFH